MGLDMLYIHLIQNHGYMRSRGTLFRALRRAGVYQAAKPKRKRRQPKPYERMEYCGQRIQVDVKHVPKECLVGAMAGQKLYQYSAIDEYSRLEFKMIFTEISGYTSVAFLKRMILFFPFPIACVQTDNGIEFTNRFLSDKPSAFDIALAHYDIRHKLIRVATPRHNGKVERSHRTDQHFFYDDHRFFSLADANSQLAVHLHWCNNRPRLCHRWRSALSVLRDFLAVAA
jgi:transposase InsO family protein